MRGGDMTDEESYASTAASILTAETLIRLRSFLEALAKEKR